MYGTSYQIPGYSGYGTSYQLPGYSGQGYGLSYQIPGYSGYGTSYQIPGYSGADTSALKGLLIPGLVALVAAPWVVKMVKPSWSYPVRALVGVGAVVLGQKLMAK